MLTHFINIRDSHGIFTIIAISSHYHSLTHIVLNIVRINRWVQIIVMFWLSHTCISISCELCLKALDTLFAIYFVYTPMRGHESRPESIGFNFKTARFGHKSFATLVLSKSAWVVCQRITERREWEESSRAGDSESLRGLSLPTLGLMIAPMPSRFSLKRIIIEENSLVFCRVSASNVKLT